MNIQASKFAEAIPLLEQVVARDQANADAYNWLAYATRRNGDPAKSIGIYQQALSLDPKHRGAHEYIGEAYLALHDLPQRQAAPGHARLAVLLPVLGVQRSEESHPGVRAQRRRAQAFRGTLSRSRPTPA